MKIHFGGNTKGVIVRPEYYRRIRVSILKLGHILTRDWIEKEINGLEKLKSQEIFDLTEKAIKEADAVVLECSDDASSVGKQMLIALENSKPVLLLTTKLSSKGIGFVGKKYVGLVFKSRYNLVNIEKLLNKFFKWATNNQKVSRFNLVIDRKLDIYLRDKAKKNSTSKTEEIRKLIINDMEK